MSDWFHGDAESMTADNPHIPNHPKKVPKGSGSDFLFVTDRDYSADGTELSAMKYVSGLINGRGGSFNNNQQLPLATFHFTRSPGQDFNLFRVINVASEFSFQFEVDCHVMWITALDGNEIAPSLQVNSVMIHPGERIDVKIIGQQSDSGCYWIRAKTLKHCKSNEQQTNRRCPDEVNAILMYGNTTQDPTQCVNSVTCPISSSNQPNVVFNCPFKDFGSSHTSRCLNMNNVSAQTLATLQQPLPYYAHQQQLQNEQHWDGFSKKHTHPIELFLNFAFTIGSSVNSRKFVHPKAPMYDVTNGAVVACNETECVAQGCECTYMITLPPQTLVRVVLLNYEPASPFPGHHSVHLHGHKFDVLRVGYPDFNTTTGLRTTHNSDIICTGQVLVSVSTLCVMHMFMC